MDSTMPGTERIALSQIWNGIRAIQQELNHPSPLPLMPSSYSDARIARLSRIALRRIQRNRNQPIPVIPSGITALWNLVRPLYAALIEANVPPQQAAAIVNSLLGFNLDAPNYGSPIKPFKNMVWSGSPWFSNAEGAGWNEGPPLNLNSNGYPVSLAPNAYADMILVENASEAGQYVLLWEGDGVVGSNNNSSFDPNNALSVTGGTVVEETPGRCVFNFTTSGQTLILRIKKVNPNNIIRNLRFMKLEYESNYQSNPFLPSYIDKVTHGSQIRLMDFGHTNFSPLKEWSDRPTIDYYHQQCYDPWIETSPGVFEPFRTKGVSLEVQCDLANAVYAARVAEGATKFAAWFCIPHQATDEYVQEMAKLIKTRINPNIEVQFEYSNECWNGIFTQGAYCREQGIALNLGDPGNDFSAQYRFFSKRTKECFQLWEAAWNSVGSADFSSRCKRIVGGWTPNSSFYNEEVLTYGNLHQLTDYIALAPYFDGHVIPHQEEIIMPDVPVANSGYRVTIDGVQVTVMTGANPTRSSLAADIAAALNANSAITSNSKIARIAATGNSVSVYYVYGATPPAALTITSVGLIESTLQTAFNQPAVGNTVNVTLDNISWIQQWQRLEIDTGLFEVWGFPGGSQVTIASFEDPNNAPQGTQIPVGAKVYPLGRGAMQVRRQNTNLNASEVDIQDRDRMETMIVNATVAQLNAYCMAEVAQNGYVEERLNKQVSMLATKGWNNVKIIAYEGGGHLISSTYSSTNKVAITAKFDQMNRSAEFGNICKTYLDTWKRVTNNAEFNWFSLSGTSSEFGWWGLFLPEETPKWRAVLEWMQANSIPN